MGFDPNICTMSEQRLKVTLADIEAARRTMLGHVLRTPMLAAPPLSALTGAQVYVKYENLQVTNSFKERGACVKLAALEESERRRGCPSDALPCRVREGTRVSRISREMVSLGSHRQRLIHSYSMLYVHFPII